MSRLDRLNGSALGLVSTRSFPAVIAVADAMVKAAEVFLVGIEKIGNGYCTAIARGRIADIRLAVDYGGQSARDFGPDQFVGTSVIPRPLDNLEAIFPINPAYMDLAPQNGNQSYSRQAVGLLETIGFPPMVGAADAMLKSANVELMSFETIGSGLCTAIIRGNVADVAVAIESGMHEAQRIGELNAIYIIPRPQDDLEQILPVASCLLEEQPQPLQLPVNLQQEELEAEPLELPQLEKIPLQLDDK